MTDSFGRRRRAAGVLLAVGGLLLSACASMPSGGNVEKVESSVSGEGQSRVRVFGVSPQKGESPQEIVRGFLEAVTSDEPRFSTAKEYLTKDRRDIWDPFARTTVLAGAPGADAAREDTVGKDGYTVEVTGSRTAVVDGTHAYASEDGDYSVNFHLTEVKGEWRIDDLPDGLVIGVSDFERIYRSINTYYHAQLGGDGASVSGGQVLVADPVYLRARIDPVTQSVAALIDGPATWLDPVVESAFPEGTRLASTKGEEQHLALDDAGGLSVRLNETGARAAERRLTCSRMAAQVLHTVQTQASTKVSKVELADAGGDRLCELTPDSLSEPGRLNGGDTKQYLIDAQNRVASLAAGSDDPKVEEGLLGSGKVRLSSVAVSRDERQGAGVSLGSAALYVAPLSGSSRMVAPALTSSAEKESNRLTTPSWDGLGDLWVADRDPENPRLLRLRGGKEEPEEIPMPSLAKGERIESLRLSSDGTRIALRVEGADGKSTLQLGRVVRRGTAADPVVTVEGLKSIAPQLKDVVAASWAGDSQLVVVGRESKGVQQLQYVGTDGSTTNQPPLPGINDVTGVAASEDERMPLLAESDYGIVRLPPDANWKTVTDKGSAPVYPG